MTKNTGGGKKHKRGARPNVGKREVIFKDDHQEYGLVDKMLGDMRCLVLCSDSTTKVCHIRGKFKRRVWINPGDTVLISTREFEDEKADVIHKYSPDEAELLKYNGEFDPSLYKNLANQDGSTNVQQLVLEVDLGKDDHVDFENI
jgi:translation initiation factor 1A